MVTYIRQSIFCGRSSQDNATVHITRELFGRVNFDGYVGSTTRRVRGGFGDVLQREADFARTVDTFGGCADTLAGVQGGEEGVGVYC